MSLLNFTCYLPFYMNFLTHINSHLIFIGRHLSLAPVFPSTRLSQKHCQKLSQPSDNLVDIYYTICYKIYNTDAILLNTLSLLLLVIHLRHHTLTASNRAISTCRCCMLMFCCHTLSMSLPISIRQLILLLIEWISLKSDSC